jgi:Short C-terminal domain
MEVNMRRRGPGPGGMAGRRMATRRAVRRTQRMRRRRRRRRVILVGGMVALGTAAVYKYSKRDVEQIEEKTGKPAEELTDEELAQAAQELGIQPQELDDAEMDQVDAADAEDDGPDDGGATAPAAGGDDYIEQLQRLASLRDSGILTDEEFEAKKKQLLGL